MKFWDSSALVAAVVVESGTASIRGIGHRDPDRVIWRLTEIEIASGLWRRRRSNDLTEDARSVAQHGADQLLSNAIVIADVPPVVNRARRLLATHNLRAADALQLAAALVATEDQPSRFAFVTLDDRLAEAASREGFTVLP